MNHISQILNHPDFYKKDFLILGTGPSLDGFVWEDHKDKNIIAIYDAIESCDKFDKVFIHFAPDYAYFKGEKLIEWQQMPTAKFKVTRAFNYAKEWMRYINLRSPYNMYSIGTTLCFFEYDCDIANHPNPNHELPYDGKFHGGDGKRYFPFHTPFPCSCTVKAIAHFLGTAGIKKVFTCGIDGGEGVSKWVTPSERESYSLKSNFDSEVQDFRDTCKNFNIEIIRL